MSTNFSSTNPVTFQDKTVTLTQFAGPENNDELSRLRCQLTVGATFVNMSQEQAKKVAMDLLLWANGKQATDVD